LHPKADTGLSEAFRASLKRGLCRPMAQRRSSARSAWRDGNRRCADL